MDLTAPRDGRLVILSDQDVLIGGRTATPTSWTWRTPKDPVSLVARQVEFGRILRGRTIARLVVGSAGVDVVAQGVVGSRITLVLQGGVDQVPGRVELRATCADGTDEVAAILQPMQAQITLVPGVAMPASLAVITADTTPAILGPLPIFAAPGASAYLEGRVTARIVGPAANPAIGATAVWNLAATLKGLGTASATVAQQTVSSFSADAAMAGCILAIASNGATISLVVTGLQGAQIEWVAGVDWTAA